MLDFEEEDHAGPVTRQMTMNRPHKLEKKDINAFDKESQWPDFCIIIKDHVASNSPRRELYIAEESMAIAVIHIPGT